MASSASAAAASAAAGGGGTPLSNMGRAFFGSLCAGTFGLGVWQLDRLYTKLQLIEVRNAQLAMPPTTHIDDIVIGNVSNGSGSPTTTELQEQQLQEQQLQQQQQYRRRHLRGVFRHDKEVLVGPRGAPPGVRMPLSGLSAKMAQNNNNNSSNNKGGIGGTTTGAAGGTAPGPQGYMVFTPLRLEPGTSDREVLWVNRGWVPKKAVPGADRPHQRHGPVERAQLDRELAETPPAWSRPQGVVRVTAVQAKVEKPRFITPEHDYSKRPLQLFWVDGVALQAIAESDDPTLLMTQVVDDVVLDKDDPANEEEQQQQQQASGASSSSSLYPLQPPVSAVGDFKTTPMIHVGYATTWFGLSAAGVYMTRKLITKGRY